MSLDQYINGLKQNWPIKVFVALYLLVVIAFIVLIVVAPSWAGVTITETTQKFINLLGVITIAVSACLVYVGVGVANQPSYLPSVE